MKISMKKLLLLFVYLSPILGIAGGPGYEWEKDRKRYTLTATEQTMPELIIKDHKQFDYVLEDNQFLMYATVHVIVLVNNSEAIQKHNRIYLPMRNTFELTDFKARAISKDGKVILFDKNNMKELNNEESGSSMRIFAIEGIEMGSEIEYYYVRKMSSRLFDRVMMQADVPVKTASFQLSCPGHLKFDFKSYFDFPAIKEEKKDDVNVYTALMNDVPALKTEPFSFHESNLKRIEYKLAYNNARSNARLYTWEDAAKTFYGILSTLDKDDEKAIDKFIKTLGDNPSASTDSRIRNIETKIKTSIQLNEQSNDPSLDKPHSITKVKIASREGITKLFFGIFNRLSIPCQPVVTCDREKSKFDATFDTWDYLDEYVLYFPETKGYLAPYAQTTRYPLIPSEFTAHEGLFIEPFEVGEVKSALGSIKQIPAADYTLNTDNLDISVSFAEDLASNTIKIKREFSGYNASFILPYFHLMTEDQKREMVDQLTKQTAPDLEMKSWVAKPLDDKFLVDVDFKSTHFLEKAGPRILFKVGELIGPQVEMYRDDKRVTDIENNYNRGYDRTLKINIPEGYVVKNADDIKFSVLYKEKDELPFLFQSDYTIENGVLTINIKEYYKQIFAPVARYEDYRKVINASADFNKVTLILERKK
jgi:hypothetical protein